MATRGERLVGRRAQRPLPDEAPLDDAPAPQPERDEPTLRDPGP